MFVDFCKVEMSDKVSSHEALSFALNALKQNAGTYVNNINCR